MENDNVISMFPKPILINIDFTCLQCGHAHTETLPDDESVGERVCTECKTEKVVPYKLIPPLDDFEPFLCVCGCDLFRLLPDDYAQCVKCGELNEPADE